MWYGLNRPLGKFSWRVFLFEKCAPENMSGIQLLADSVVGFVAAIVLAIMANWY
jgi:hypothetical protein